MRLPTILGETAIHTIRAYETDINKRATPIAILKLMHETAQQNVMRLGISVWNLEPHHLAWVLMRQTVQIQRLPELGEQITILTYPAGFDRVFTFRDYQVFDTEKSCIIQSASTWLLMDTNQRKMTSIPDFVLALASDIPAPEQCLPRCNFSFQGFQNANNIQQSQVGWFDLDYNAHVNNVQYVKWMLETLPEDILSKKSLHTLDIQFRAECRLGDKVEASYQQQDTSSFFHQLMLSGGNKELSLAKTSWR
jgi:acyl-ACP thioesterase